MQLRNPGWPKANQIGVSSVACGRVVDLKGFLKGIGGQALGVTGIGGHILNLEFIAQKPCALVHHSRCDPGRIGRAIADIELVSLQIQNAKRNHFFLGRHIVIKRLHGLSPAGFTSTRKVAKIDRGFTVDTDLESAGFLICLLLYEANIVKDGIGFRDFFSGLVFWTLRNL